MSRLRRYFKNGDTVFVTSVTLRRLPILETHGALLASVFKRFSGELEVTIVAQTILPDHFHSLIRSERTNASEFLQRVKMSFATSYRKSAGMRSGRLWQHRFYDHIIRDQEDLNKHIDYIHYNAVKHGYVNRPRDWKLSSIHWPEFAKVYAPDWGVDEELVFEGEFGE